MSTPNEMTMANKKKTTKTETSSKPKAKAAPRGKAASKGHVDSKAGAKKPNDKKAGKGVSGSGASGKATAVAHGKAAGSKRVVGKGSEESRPGRSAKAKPVPAAKPSKKSKEPSRVKAGPGVVRATPRRGANSGTEGTESPKARGKAQLRVVTQPPPSDVSEPAAEPSAASTSLSEADAAVDDESYLLGLLEALLFCSDHPVEVKELARAAGLDRKRTVELLQRLIELYAQRGLRLEHVAEGYSFRTHPRYAEFVRKLLAARPVRLSRAQLETLAIIAYRQPVTRPDVDDIRGVDSGPVLKGLLERDLIKIIGKKDEPGRPILYGTSKGFLELFNLTALSDLPTLRDFVELNEESRRKFAEETGEDAPEEPLSELAAAAASAETGEMAQANQAAAAIADTDAAETSADAPVDEDESDDDSDEDDDDEDDESDDDGDEDEDDSDDDDDEVEEEDDSDDEDEVEEEDDEESDDDEDEDDSDDEDDDDDLDADEPSEGARDDDAKDEDDRDDKDSA